MMSQPVEFVADVELISDMADDKYKALKIRLFPDQFHVINDRKSILFHSTYVNLREIVQDGDQITLIWTEEEHNFFITRVVLKIKDKTFMPFLALLNQNKWRVLRVKNGLEGLKQVKIGDKTVAAPASESIEVVDSARFFKDHPTPRGQYGESVSDVPVLEVPNKSKVINNSKLRQNSPAAEDVPEEPKKELSAIERIK